MEEYNGKIIKSCDLRVFTDRRWGIDGVKIEIVRVKHYPTRIEVTAEHTSQARAYNIALKELEMMIKDGIKRKFKGCKNLDFEQESYICEVVTILDHLAMSRVDAYNNIQLCQMCKLRGRINNPHACIGKYNAMCDRYEEIVFEF